MFIARRNNEEEDDDEEEDDEEEVVAAGGKCVDLDSYPSKNKERRKTAC